VRTRAVWFVGLLLFWLTLGGSLDWEHVFLGTAIAWLVILLREAIVPRDRLPVRTAGRAAGTFVRRVSRVAAYVWFLLKEIVKANIQVALIVLNPRLPISPAFLHYRPRLRTAWGRVLMGNSITLTPGTLTVELEDGEYLIHTLTRNAAHALPGWAAEGRIAELETLAGEVVAGV
jgi:multicomponent Na+:H+ antiporter subunit E